MITAVVYLGADELFVTAGTPELLEPRKHLPEDFVPRQAFLSEVHNKLVDVPMLVGLMLGHNASVGIDE